MLNQTQKAETTSPAVHPSTETDSRTLPYKIRILGDSIDVYTGAGNGYIINGSVSQFDCPEIVEEVSEKGRPVWGRLKSGAGWIALDQTEPL